jgi:hypothetical protein
MALHFLVVDRLTPDAYGLTPNWPPATDCWLLTTAFAVLRRVRMGDKTLAPGQGRGDGGQARSA